jgi:hypothetical protein
MKLLVMLPAEPTDNERKGVVIMMSINPETAADLTLAALQFSAAESSGHGAVGPELVAVAGVPLVLSPPFLADGIRGDDLGGGVHQRTSWWPSPASSAKRLQRLGDSLVRLNMTNPARVKSVSGKGW